MIPLLQPRHLIGIVLAILAGVGLWYLHHDGYEEGRAEVQVAWDADRLQRDEQQKAALVEYANRLNQAEVQHDQDQALINQLHDAAGRVRIHLPACPGNAAGAGENGSAGVLSDRMDQRFAELQERIGSLIARCDQLNIDAIRANRVQP